MTTQPFGVRLKTKITVKLAAFIEQQGVSRNLVVNQAIDEFLERRSPNQKPSEKALSFFRGFSFLCPANNGF